MFIEAPRPPTIIVVGSGRSGTSSIGRILHEDLNICAGHFLKPPDKFNPKGYYEDLISHSLVRAMAAGDNKQYNPGLYLTLMNGFHKGCLNWSIKDPWFLYLPDEYLKQLQPKLCIVATRDLQGTLNSWLKIWRANKTSVAQPPQKVIDHYTKLTVERQQRAEQLQKIWPNIIKIDFTTKVPDEEIKTAIRHGLTSASYLK